jgi:hypothetical protein
MCEQTKHCKVRIKIEVYALLGCYAALIGR